jgi:hypothetical protein
MRLLTKLVLLGGAAYAAKWAFDTYLNAQPTGSAQGTQRTGYDTPTGTDPRAKYERPGYEDKSFGQAVNQDFDTADRLLEETGGDADAAALKFRNVSAGAPALERQAARETEEEPTPHPL